MEWTKSRRSARPQVLSYHGAAILWAGAVAVLMMAVMAGAFSMAKPARPGMIASVACTHQGDATVQGCN